MVGCRNFRSASLIGCGAGVILALGVKSMKEKELKINDKSPSVWGIVADVISIILIFVLIVAIILTQIYSFSLVQGSSMLSTIQNSDYAVCINTNDVQYHDIVIADTGEDRFIIKRVVGMPGDRLLFKTDKSGRVVLWIDSGDGFVEIDESAFINNGYMTRVGFEYKGNLIKLFEGEGSAPDEYILTLADDEFFLMGDNRDFSTDSRAYGPFKKSEIVSKVKRIVNKEKDEKLYNFVGFIYSLLSKGKTIDN